MVISFASRSIYQTKSELESRHYCLQVLISLRIHDLESQGLHSSPIQYYDFLQNRVMIIFKPKFEEPDDNHPEFNLVLSKKHNYDTVSTRNDCATTI
jgi:ubiquitin carboxyl-terminal hydrolase 7